MERKRRKPWLIGEHRIVRITIKGKPVVLGYLRERINPRKHADRMYQWRRAVGSWVPGAGTGFVGKFPTWEDAEAALLVQHAKEAASHE